MSPKSQITEAQERILDAQRPRLERQAIDARTVNQRAAVCGHELCFIVASHELSPLWLELESLAGRKFYAHTEIVNLAEHSDLMVSELRFT